jgi:hypothetical protein
MKAFPGKRCSICKESIPAGTDVHYDGENKTLQHWSCYEKPQPPGPESFRLADELGFLAHGDAMAADWPMLLLSGRTGGTAAGRAESKTRGQQNSLFKVSEREKLLSDLWQTGL